MLQPSGSRYANVFNTQGGLIAADENFNPKTSSPEIEEQGLPYVQRKQWSDLTFLTWQHLCSTAGTDVGGLKYVFQVSISNTETEDMMDEALSRSGATYGDWENRQTWYAGSEEYNALLGTPNSSGVAWLLINHKRQMGIKTIKAISVFESVDPLDKDETIKKYIL